MAYTLKSEVIWGKKHNIAGFKFFGIYLENNEQKMYVRKKTGGVVRSTNTTIWC